MKIINKILLFATIGLVTVVCLYSYSTKEVNKKQIIKGILDYPMDDIIKRCQKDHNYTNEDMIILEKELKKYLILSALITNNGSGVGMYSKDVDNLWHSFILFTKDYADFCSKFCNHFIHHIPETNKNTTPEKLEEIRNDFQAFIKNYEETFQEEINSIWLLDMC